MACLPANGEKGRKHVPGERAEFFFLEFLNSFFFFFLKEKFAEEIFFFLLLVFLEKNY